MNRIFELLSMPPSYYIGADKIEIILIIFTVTMVSGLAYRAFKDEH